MCVMDPRLSGFLCVIFVYFIVLCWSDARRTKDFRVLFLNATV